MSASRDLQEKGTYVPRRFGRSLLIVRPLGARSSCAIHRAVERPVQACPHVLHNPAWPTGEDCGMPGALALVLAAALTSLPPLPQRGLALETKAGVELQSLGGPPLATRRGLDLAPDQALAHKAVFRDGRGRLFVLAGGRLRRALLRRGCRATDVQLTVCPRAVRGAPGSSRVRRRRSGTGSGPSARRAATPSSHSGRLSAR